MKTLLLLSYLIFYLNIPIIQQANPSVKIQGSIWDAEIGIDLDTKIYGIINSKKVELGISKDQQLDLNIPTNVTELIFETEGYKTLKIPIYFHGSFLKYTSAFLSLQTIKGEGNIKEDNAIILATQAPFEKQFAKHALFTKKNNQEFRLIRLITPNINETRYSCNYHVSRDSSKYFRVIVDLGSDFPAYKKDFEVGNGINVVDLNYYGKNENFESENIYFKRGNYDLTKEAKAELENIAEILQRNSAIRISIEGFTDNVGEESKNITLSHYRAKVVANYLRQNGINENRLELKWQAPGTTHKEEADLKLLRKVDIKVID